MTTIDIRSTEPTNVSKIVFADYSSTNAVAIDLPGSNTRFRFEDGDGCGESYFRVSDIDNMILALQKAKELVSK